MSNIFDRMAEEHGHSSPEAEPEADPSSKARTDHITSDETLRTSAEVKKLTQELLKYGHLEEAQGADLFRRAVVHERAIQAALEPLDLALRLDTYRGVAFLVVARHEDQDSAAEDGWSHPLVRRQRLTLEQSLLVALLRQAFIMHEQEAGVGQSAAMIAVEDLLPHYLAYFGDSGSDTKNESRLLNLLEQLKTYGIVSEVDQKQEVTIRPLIAHLANPESLSALLAALKDRRGDVDALEHEEL